MNDGPVFHNGRTEGLPLIRPERRDTASAGRPFERLGEEVPRSRLARTPFTLTPSLLPDHWSLPVKFDAQNKVKEVLPGHSWD